MTPQPPLEAIPSPSVHPLLGIPCNGVPTYDLLIVDGSYLIHRILYASGSKGDPPFSEMYNSNHDPTGAIYGCLKTLRANINHDDFQARDMVVIWDGRPRGLSPRRVAMYPQYKVPDDSKKNPTELAESLNHRSLLEEQRPHLIRLLSLLGVPSVNIPYREGDDIIGCFIRQISSNLKVLVISDDRDYYQLIRPNVHVYRAGLRNPQIVCEENFQQRTNILNPARYLVYAAICGDGSDNITGIPKVGDTTAQRVANDIILTNGMVTYVALKDSVERLKISDKRNAKLYSQLLDNVHIVTRNLQLMDLRLESWTPTEQDIMKAEIAKASGLREMDVIREFHRWEFKSYLEDVSNWLQPFRRLSHQNVL